MVYIYALVCPELGQIRYIGKSTNPDKRIRAHIGAAIRFEYNHHTARWIRRLAGCGKRPSLQVLEAVPPGQCWRQVERLWIAKAKEQGWPITNTTAGGEGLDYIDPDDAKAYKKNWRRGMQRYWSSEKCRQHIARMVSAGQSPEVAARRRESISKVCSTDAYRQKMARINRAIAARPGMSERRSDQFTRLWRSPEYRAACMQGFSSPDCKRKQSESKIRAWSDPEVRQRMANRWGDDERAAQRAAIDSRREKMRPSPEGRERQRQAMRDLWAKRKAEGKRLLSD